ncbi:MAG: RnfABCDGE type electron transport complex subunit D [Candidatus Micrarchaeota archaeon]|nr:RnfABCDGE type electron transport complex subunit D [Candidatus Micrarchaeota archaeon]
MDNPVSPMYIWAIALLSALAIVSGYTLHALPISLVVAVASAGTIEILIRNIHRRHKFKIPFSGLITGLIIGSVAPINAPLALVVVAAAIAVASKFFIQYKSSNIFNPATIGLIVALPLFGLGDEWWIASNYNFYGLAVTLTPILVILAYEAKRLTTGMAFVLASLALALALGGTSIVSAGGIAAALFGINYYFAFVMLIEPKTSPNGRYAQAAYGISVAALCFALALFRVPYPLLVSLLAGNTVYLAYRSRGKR